MSVSDQLKAAVEKAEAKGETRYKIAQESRVRAAPASRKRHKDLLDSLTALVDADTVP